MHQYRQVIQRLRLGESDRAIARAERVGRVTVASPIGLARPYDARKRQNSFRPLDNGSHINVQVERRAASTLDK